MTDNKNTFTYKKYRSNIYRYLFRGLVAILIFFIILYIILKIFSATLSPKIFTLIFFCAVVVVFIFDKYIKKKTNFLLNKNYYTWGRGAGAEWNSMKSLDKLEPEYKKIYDLSNAKGNVDSLCIGPTGVYVVETKAHKCLISWEGRLLRSGKKFEKDFIKQTHAEVYYVKDILSEKFGKEFKVQGILEFPNGKIDKDSIRGKINGVWIGGRGFAKWVIQKKKNEHLSNEEIEKIYSYLNVVKNNKS